MRTPNVAMANATGRGRLALNDGVGSDDGAVPDDAQRPT